MPPKGGQRLQPDLGFLLVAFFSFPFSFFPPPYLQRVILPAICFPSHGAGGEAALGAGWKLGKELQGKSCSAGAGPHTAGGFAPRPCRG